jgi:hypothetical protein
MGSSAPRLRAGLRLGLAALFIVACDSGAGNLFASFETRCAGLPPSRVGVATVPFAYVQDETQAVDQLTVRGGYTPGRHLTFGLTTVHFGHQTEIGIRAIDDAAGARTCGTVDVDVRLSMQPVTVYLAQELDGSPCARNATLEHEMKHVAVFAAVLDEASRELAAGLGGAIGTGLQRAPSREALQRQVNARVNDYLSDFMRRHKQDMDARQNAVDSVEEYARVRNACAQ